MRSTGPVSEMLLEYRKRAYACELIDRDWAVVGLMLRDGGAACRCCRQYRGLGAACVDRAYDCVGRSTPRWDLHADFCVQNFARSERSWRLLSGRRRLQP